EGRPIPTGWDFGPSRTELQAARPEAELIFVPIEEVSPECEALKAGKLAPPSLGIGVNEEEESMAIEKLRRPLINNDLSTPAPVHRQKFYIHKLQYRAGDVILGQIQQIAASMQNTPQNIELLAAIGTMQWLQDAKSLVITATPLIIDKIRELIE